MFHINLPTLITNIGYIGIFTIIFIETAFFVGFFLPGDSLLFVAGLLAQKHIFHLNILLPIATILAIAGYFIGFWFGKYLGAWLLKRPDSFWFKRSYIDHAHDFYKKHGGKALIIGRLVPIVRTFIPIVAGMAKMDWNKYALYNVIGGIVWVCGLTIAGYYLGSIIPDAQKYILPIVALVILLSITPGIIAVYKNWRAARNDTSPDKNV